MTTNAGLFVIGQVKDEQSAKVPRAVPAGYSERDVEIERKARSPVVSGHETCRTLGKLRANEA
jgi:hypothetical protein